MLVPGTSRLSSQQRLRYEEAGFFFVEEAFPPEELYAIDVELDRLSALPVEGRVFEEDGTTLRALHGMHLYSELFARLIRDRRMLEAAQEILGGDVYLHQYKLNFKRALGGDLWPWHQDFIYWEREDGVRRSQLVNVALLLDEVDEFNGPMCFIPGSHTSGVLEPEGEESAQGAGGWQVNFGRQLKYTVNRGDLARLVQERGIEAPKGAAGTMLIFHPNIVHSSGPNMSMTDRRLLIATYNRTDNRPAGVGEPRPEFLVGRDFRPLRAVGDSA